MGPGAIAVRLQDSVQKVSANRGGRRLVNRTTLPERLRGLKEATATIASEACSWTKDMRKKIKTQPQMYPDYVMEGETLYRNIPHRAGIGDVAS